MRIKPVILAVLGLTTLIGSLAAGRADFAVEVDIENLSSERKTNWPVVLTVRRVFGNNLPSGAINREGFHIYDSAGQDMGIEIEPIPPYDQIGNDELIFVVPSIEPGQELTFRITNTQESGKKTTVDLAASPHNLVKNGGFEAGQEKPDGFKGPAGLDRSTKHSGNNCLLLKGKGRVTVNYAEPIPIRKGARYYFGAWGKTDNVSRHTYYHMSKGGYFDLSGFDNGYGGDLMPASDTLARWTPQVRAERMTRKRTATVFPQCATRDWAKVTFRTRDFTDWGIEQITAWAVDDTASLTIILDQQKQFFMSEDRTTGRWWVDDVVLIEQPKVRVRFDKQLAPHMNDGIFLFNRPTSSPLGNYLGRWTPYCAMPFAHEAVEKIDRVGTRGQRVPFVLGLYQTKPLATVEVKLRGDALRTESGQELALTEVEWLPGYLGPKPDMLMRKMTGPVDANGAPRLPYFVASFEIPSTAKPGRYAGSLDVLVDGKPYRSVPISLAVQDLDEPDIRDTFLSFIWQGKKLIPYSDEALSQYSKAGFNSITPFFTFLNFKSVEPPEVDFDDLSKKIDRLLRFGIDGGLCLYTDFDLGSRHSGGSVWKTVKTEEKYKEVVERVYDEFQEHPEWPRIIFMTWDEPNLGETWVPGKHGGPDPRMGWVNEVRPAALTNVDVAFKPFEACLPYYTMPTFDDPPDWCGPEIYRYIKAQGKDFGFAGAKEPGECPRYEIGMMMVASGGRYFHQWHLQFPSKLMDVADGKVLRSYEMVQVGEGIADFKANRVLQNLIGQALASGEARKQALAAEAQAYLARIHSVWNADHINEACYPRLGYAYQWGYDRFYDDWRRQMMKYAVALKGAAWVE